MVAFLSDEDFNGRILRGLRLREPDIDITRVQDIGLRGAPDSDVLEAAASAQRVLITHDARTMPVHFRERLACGKPTAGVLIVDDLAPILACIEDLLLVANCSEQSDWPDLLMYLPFA